MIDFDAYDIYRDVSTLDHHLWLQDIPLCQSCNKYNGGTRIFPMNLSISDWSAYYKVAKPKDFTLNFISLSFNHQEKDIRSLKKLSIAFS